MSEKDILIIHSANQFLGTTWEMIKILIIAGIIIGIIIVIIKETYKYFNLNE